jgi:hypothetical protein
MKIDFDAIYYPDLKPNALHVAGTLCSKYIPFLS